MRGEAVGHLESTVRIGHLDYSTMRMDTVIGLIEFVAYIAAILALSAAITVAVVKLSPSRGAKKTADPAE